jgi:hypothetical protein
VSHRFKNIPGLGLAAAGGLAAGSGVGAAGGAGVGASEGVHVGAEPPPNQLLTQVSTLPSIVAVTISGGMQDDGEGPR